MKIFVAGLPYDLDDAELVEIFEKFGAITSAKVAIDRETGKSKGFAFVDMPNEEEAREAVVPGTLPVTDGSTARQNALPESRPYTIASKHERRRSS